MSRSLLSSALLLPALAGLGSAQEKLQPLLGHPLPDLDRAQLDLFQKGRVAFNTPLTEPDGLGPIFNEPACASCHNLPNIGGSSTRAVTRFGQAGPPFDPLADLGGSLLQDQSLDLACREDIPPEADVTAQRVTPICFGAGLLETIPDSEIHDNEANQPVGLNGVTSDVLDLSDLNLPPRPARFGWKGVIHNAVSFSIDASLNEMGLTSVFLPAENAPNGDQNLLAQCDTVADPEDGRDLEGKTRIERFTDFQRLLAAPPQTPKAGMTGELHFQSVGCADCHRPTYVTGTAPEAALSGKTIHPYSDFLLHDMGSLGDQIAQANASETQMMTRALWGVRHRDAALMHDGRVSGGTFAQNMHACIQEHMGEASAARLAYDALAQSEKDALIAFLGSLGQAEFDIEVDNDLDEFDWFFIEPFVTGPGSFYTPDSPEAFCDVDADGDFDLVDFDAFQRGFTGQTLDPETPAKAGSTSLHVSVRSGGNTVWVAPNGIVRYEVRGILSNDQTQGLGMFSFDLSYDGGVLAPLEVPCGSAMDAFAMPAGATNPAGFGGTRIGGSLVQVGGAQNTIEQSFAPYPNGDVVLNVAQYGSAMATLATGSLVAPATRGTYTVALTNVVANAITADATGSPFWKVQPVPQGLHRNLEIVVEDGGAEIYCVAKVNSAGGTPRMQWKGRPSATGSDDFHLWATDVMGNETGLFLYGFAAGNTPFFGGTLCIGGSLKRSPVLTTSGTKHLCNGRLDFHMTQSYMALQGLTPGTKVHAQGWYRDPSHPDGTGVGLTDAISFEIKP